ANRGLPEVVNGETVYKQTPEEFASFIPDLIANGAGFVGGCCGTSPEIIRAVRATVDALK
ncbi:MAG: homocysteine S-methyltransferase family protein, partial [Thermoguttaceae bacterium]